MAEGRMIRRDVSLTPALARVDDRTRLWWTWALPHLDVEGRITADPEVLRAKVVPMLQDWTTADVEHAISAAASVGLVIPYTTDRGGKALYFPLFHEWNSVRTDRERPSSLRPAPGELQEYARNTPGGLPLNGNNGGEGKNGNAYTASVSADSKPSQVASCVERLMEFTGERDRQDLWTRLTERLGIANLDAAISATQQTESAGTLRQTRGKYVLGVCKKKADELNINLGLKKPGGSHQASLNGNGTRKGGCAP